MKILVVEDDKNLQSAIALTLARELSAVCNFVTTAEKALEILSVDASSYDAAILDLMLPGGPGAEDDDEVVTLLPGERLLNSLRAMRIKMPVLALTAVSDLERRIRVISSGADDFLVKPFAQEELAARVGAIIRRANNSIDSAFRCKNMLIDLNNRVVTNSDTQQRVHLTPTEYAILETLVMSRDDTAGIRKEAFIDVMYPNDVTGYGGGGARSPKILDVFICKLRAKLKENVGFDPIVTVRGKGYRMLEAETAEI